MRLTRTLVAEAPFALVLLVAAAGFTYTTVRPEHWLRGVIVIAAAFILAGLLRAVLTTARAGMLVVRHKVFDSLCYLALGVSIFVFAVALPR